jgi:hypothetical protein
MTWEKRARGRRPIGRRGFEAGRSRRRSPPGFKWPQRSSIGPRQDMPQLGEEVPPTHLGALIEVLLIRAEA